MIGSHIDFICFTNDSHFSAQMEQYYDPEKGSQAIQEKVRPQFLEKLWFYSYPL